MIDSEDPPYFEDGSKKATFFSLEASVSGDNYIETKENLERALNRKGSGDLVHPTYGILEAICVSYSVSEGLEDGLGAAFFTITFIEVSQIARPVAKKSNLSLIGQYVALARELVVDVFGKNFNLVQLPTAVIDESLRNIRPLAMGLDSIVNNVLLQTQNVAVLKAKIDRLGEFGDSIVNFPKRLGLALDDLYATFLTLVDNPQDLYREFIERVRIIDRPRPVPSPGEVTDVQMTRIRNENALNTLDKQLSLLVCIESLFKVTHSNINEAVKEAKGLEREITSFLEFQDLDYETYNIFYNLKSVVQTSLPLDRDKLKTIFKFRLKETTPSFVVSFEQYGTYKKADELALLNDIFHPLFMPPNKELEGFHG